MMRDIRYCLDKLSSIDRQITEETSLKTRSSLACDMLELAERIQTIAIDELEYLILHRYEILTENQYSALFTYYKEKEHWNKDVIIKLIEQQKLDKLPTLNSFCSNMKILILALVDALKSDFDSLLYDSSIDEGISSLNYYFQVILDNCPKEDKESTQIIIEDMKQECAEAFADRIADKKKAEYDELREEYYNDYYIKQCDEVLKFVPDNKKILSLKNYFLEQKISDMENGLDEE